MTTVIPKYKLATLPINRLTPVNLFKRLQGNNPFLLESASAYRAKGKYSFLGMNPHESIIGKGEQTIITSLENNRATTINKHILNYLRDDFPAFDLDIPLPFFGGAVGYIGYDATLQQTSKNSSNSVHSYLMVYKDVFVFDHIAEKIYMIAINTTEQLEENLDERIKKLKQIVKTKRGDQTKDLASVNFVPEHSKQHFLKQAEKVQQLIAKGEVDQVVISAKFSGEISGHPFSLYEQLRKRNPSPYMFYINFSDHIVLGSSPESMVQTIDNQVITNPIAGTRPRGRTLAEDEQLARELKKDPKEIAEHDMLVTLNKEELANICTDHGLTIPVHKEIQKFQYVMHLVTEIHGTLKKDYSSIDALKACLPAGTVSGFPKRRAMEIIDDLEPGNRGIYAGSIGYINFNHHINMALAIRTMIIKNERAYVQAGAGIVKDSNLEKEYEEILQKSCSLLNIQREED